MRARVRKPGTMKGLKRDALMSIMICMVEDRKLLRNRLMHLSVMQTKKKHEKAAPFMVYNVLQLEHMQLRFRLKSHLKHAFGRRSWQGLPSKIWPNLCCSICPPKQTDALIV